MEITEITHITDAFVAEIAEARSGRPSSLPHIVHTLPEQALVTPEEPFQVMVIGGSVYQSAVCTFVDGKLQIAKRSNGEKPVFTTKEDFLTFIDSLYDRSITKIAMNFAFPLEPQYDGHILDGILTHAVKENPFLGMIGAPIGATVSQYLEQRHGTPVAVSVANDTICTLLSGLHEHYPEELACGIVGTGINFAYFMEPNTPVNLETANFDAFVQSEYGKQIDEESVHPGKVLFEKEIAGAYLYQHFNAYAHEHGLPNRVQSTRELDEFAKTCNGTGGLCEFTKDLLERSAQLTAVQVAAIVKTQKRDMKFIMAGSLFWKAWLFRETVQETVARLVPEYSVEFIGVESCEIFGAAKLLG